MKILHIVAGVSPESGVTAVVTRLAVEQQRLGHEVCVAWTVKREVLKCESAKVLKLSEGVVREVVFARSWPHFLFFSWGMLFGLGKEVANVDVVHVHSNWTFPVWWGAWLALRHTKALVMSPHGCLDPLRLSHSWRKKKAVGWMDRLLLRRASLIHATCEAEAEWIRRFLNVKKETGNWKLETGGSSEGVGRRVEEAQNIGQLSKESPKIVVISNGVDGPCERDHVVT